MQVIEKIASRGEEGGRRGKRHAWQRRKMFARVEHQAIVKVRPRVPERVAAFKDHVIDASPGQLARRREPRGAGADDDRVVRIGQSPSTSLATMSLHL